jgi:hypothetical protein
LIPTQTNIFEQMIAQASELIDIALMGVKSEPFAEPEHGGLPLLTIVLE